MNILKSYAHEVVSYHPEDVRDELFAEIYDSLCEEYSDWQVSNRDSTEAEFLDATREHPIRYATRLAAEGSPWLIGPQFYFSFISALKIGVSLTTGFYLLLAVITAFATGDYWRSFLRMLLAIPESLLWVSASILGVFVALEKSGERASWLDNWSAKDLRSQQSHRAISRGETFFDLGISTLGLLWVADIIRFPSLIRHDGVWVTGSFDALPNWFWWLAAILLAFDIGFCLLKLTRSFWSRSFRLITITTNLLWMTLLAWVIAQPQLLFIDDTQPVDITPVLPFINQAADIVLLIICAVLAWDTIAHVWRLLFTRDD